MTTIRILQGEAVKRDGTRYYWGPFTIIAQPSAGYAEETWSYHVYINHGPGSQSYDGTHDTLNEALDAAVARRKQFRGD